MISENFTCSVCDEIYEEPKILPCGETICNKCVPRALEKSKKNGTSQKCHFCSKYHEVPKQGFPDNKLASILLKEKPRQGYQSIVFQESSTDVLGTILETIKLENDKLKDSVLNPVDSIDKYCTDLKTQIQEATDRKLKQINDLNEKLLDQVDSFRKNCMKSFDKDTRSIYEETSSNIDKFHEKWHKYLASELYKRDDDEIAEAIQKAKKVQFCLKKSAFDTENLIFNGKLLDFEENIRQLNAESIGILQYKNKTFTSFKHFQAIDLRKHLRDQHSGCKYIKLISLENGSYVMAYFSSNDSIKLVLLDRNYMSIKEKNESGFSAGFFINYFKMYTYRSTIIIYSWMNKSYMKIFDENLISKCYYPNFDGYFTALTFDETSIFCLDALKSILYIYDWNIKLQATFRTNNLDLNFYLPNSTSQIEWFESKLYLKHKTYISVINKSDGKFVKSFNGILANRFMLDRREKHLITFNDESKKISYYTLDGEVIFETELQNFPDGLKYFIDHRGCIIFYDDYKAIMYR